MIRRLASLILLTIAPTLAVADGLKPDERVVTTGFTRLSNGTKVAVQDGNGQGQPNAAPEAAPSASAAPEGGRGEGRRKREGAAKGEGRSGESKSGESKGGDGQGGDGKEWRRRKSESAETAPSTPSAKQ